MFYAGGSVLHADTDNASAICSSESMADRLVAVTVALWITGSAGDRRTPNR
jgi:hypothetical protein